MYQGNTATCPTDSTSFSKVSNNIHQGKGNTTWTKGTVTVSVKTEPIHTETETMGCPESLEMTPSGEYQGMRSTTETTQSLAELPMCTMSRPTEALNLMLPYHILYQGTLVNTSASNYKVVSHPNSSMGQSIAMTSSRNVYRTEMPAQAVQGTNTGSGFGGGEMDACLASENIPKMESSKRRTVPIILARSRKLKTPVPCTVPNQSVSFSSVTTVTPFLQSVIPVLSSPVHVTQGSQLGGVVGTPVSLCSGRSVPLSIHQEQQQTAPMVTVLGERDIRQALTSTVQSHNPSVCSVGLSPSHSTLVSSIKSNYSAQQFHGRQELHCTVPNVTVLRGQSTAKCLSSHVLSHTPAVDSIATTLFHSPVNANSIVTRGPWWQQHAASSALVEPSVVLSYYPSVGSVGTTLLHSPSGYNVNRTHVWPQQQQQQQQRVPMLREHLSTTQTLSKTLLPYTPSIYSLSSTVMHPPYLSNINSNVTGQQQWPQRSAPTVPALGEQSMRQSPLGTVLSYSPSSCSVSTTLLRSPLVSNANISVARQQWPQQAAPTVPVLGEQSIRQSPLGTVLSYSPSSCSVSTTLLRSPLVSNANISVARQQWPQQAATTVPVLGEQSIRQSPLGTVLSYSPSSCIVSTTILRSPLVSNANISVARQQWPQQAAPSVPALGEQSMRQSPLSIVLSYSPSVCTVDSTLLCSPLVSNANISVARLQQAAPSVPVLSEQSIRRSPLSTVLSNNPPVYSVSTTLLNSLLVPRKPNINVARHHCPQQAPTSVPVLGAQSIRQALPSTVLFSNPSAYSANTALLRSPSLSNVKDSFTRQQHQWEQRQHSHNPANSVQGSIRPPFTNISLSDKQFPSSNGSSPSYDKPSLSRWRQEQSKQNTVSFERQGTGHAVTSTVFSDSLSRCSASTIQLPSYNVKSSVSRKQCQQHQPARPSMVFSRGHSTKTTFSYEHSVCSVDTTALNSLTVSNVTSSAPRYQQQKDSSWSATAVSTEPGTGRHAVLGSVFPGGIVAPLSRSSLVSSGNSSVSRQQHQQQSSSTTAVLMEQGTGGQALLDNVSSTRLYPLPVSSSNSYVVRPEQTVATTAVSRVQSTKQAFASTPSSDNLSVSDVNTNPYSDVLCVSSTKASSVCQTQQPPTILDRSNSGANDSVGHKCSLGRTSGSPTPLSPANIEETFSISSLLPELTHDQGGSDESPRRDSSQNDDDVPDETTRRGAARNDAFGGEPSVSAPTTTILKTMPFPRPPSSFDTSRVGEATDGNPLEVTFVNLGQDRAVDPPILQQNHTVNFHPNRELIPRSGNVRSLSETDTGQLRETLTSCDSATTSASSIHSILTKAAFALSTPHSFHAVRGRHRHLAQKDSGTEAVSFLDLTGDNLEVTDKSTATVSAVRPTRDESLVVPSVEVLEFTADAPFLDPSSKDLRLGPTSSRQEGLTENKKDHATVPVTVVGEENLDGEDNAARKHALVNSSPGEDSELASFQRHSSRMLQKLVVRRPTPTDESTQNDGERKQEKQLRVANIDEICAKLETVLMRVSSKKGTDFRWLVEDVKHSLQKEPAIETSDVLSSLSKLLQIKRSELEFMRAQLHESSEALRMLIVNCKSELLCQESNYSTTVAEKRKTDLQIDSLSKRMRNSGLTMERWCTMMQELNHREEVLNKERKMLKRKWTHASGSS